MEPYNIGHNCKVNSLFIDRGNEKLRSLGQREGAVENPPIKIRYQSGLKSPQVLLAVINTVSARAGAFDEVVIL